MLLKVPVMNTGECRKANGGVALHLKSSRLWFLQRQESPGSDTLVYRVFRESEGELEDVDEAVGAADEQLSPRRDRQHVVDLPLRAAEGPVPFELADAQQALCCRS